MTLRYLWECDGCGLEAVGYAGAPAPGWVRVNAAIEGHVRSRDREFCPECATHVDAVALAQSGDLLVNPRGSTPKKGKAKVEEEGENGD